MKPRLLTVLLKDYPRERIHLRHRIFAHALRRRRPLCASRRRTRPTGGRARPPTRVAVVPCSAMWSIAPQWVPVPVRPDRHQNVTCTAARPTRPPLLQMVLRRRRRVHPQWAHRQWVQRRPVCNVLSGGTMTASISALPSPRPCLWCRAVAGEGEARHERTGRASAGARLEPRAESLRRGCSRTSTV